MAQRLVSKVWNETDQTISFFWYVKEGKDIPMTGPDGKQVVFDLKRCPEEIRGLLMLHGGTQKTSDGFAGSAKDAGGDVKKQRELIVSTVVDAIARLYAGEWTERGEGVKREPALLYAAMVRAFPAKFVNEAAAKEWFGVQPEQVQKGLPTVPAIVEAKAAIQIERAKARASSGSDAALAALTA